MIFPIHMMLQGEGIFPHRYIAIRKCHLGTWTPGHELYLECVIQGQRPWFQKGDPHIMHLYQISGGNLTKTNPLAYSSTWHAHDVQCDALHYNSVIMGAMASQITSLTIVYSTVYSVTDQRKYQSSALLAFGRGIHRWPVNSPHKGPVTRKISPFDGVIIIYLVFPGILYMVFNVKQTKSLHPFLPVFQLFIWQHKAIFVQWVMVNDQLGFCTNATWGWMHTQSIRTLNKLRMDFLWNSTRYIKFLSYLFSFELCYLICIGYFSCHICSVCVQ